MNKIVRNLKSNIISVSGGKKYNCEELVSKVLYIQKDNIEYFCLSSNTIKMFRKEDGTLFFFRECYRKKRISLFFEERIEEFFEGVCLRHSAVNFKQKIPIPTKFNYDEIVAFKEYIDKKKQNKNFWEIIANMDLIMEEFSISIWDDHYHLSNEFMEKINLKDCPHSSLKLIPLFTWYLRGMASTYRYAKNIRNGQLIMENPIKNVITFQLAEVIGFEDIVACSDFGKVIVDGKEIYGVLSVKAPGVRACDIEIEEKSYTPALKKSLSRLYILDILCYQVDHGPNNYNIILEDGEYPVGVCAFDNDNPSTFFPYLGIRNIGVSSNNIFLKSYSIERLLSLDDIKGLVEVDYGKVIGKMKPYLNKIQIFALLVRTKKLCSYLRKHLKKYQD